MTYTKEICLGVQECFYGKIKIYMPGRVTRIRFVAYDGSLKPSSEPFRTREQLEQILATITIKSVL